MEDSKKPANVLDKIIEGKLGSFYKQVVLTDQESIRDPKKTVQDIVAEVASALGTPITIARFARLRVGETAP
jgi:elongation factor Ts